MKRARLLLLGAWLATTSCDPFHTGFDEIEGAVYYVSRDEKL